MADRLVRRGPHPDRALSAVKVRQLSSAGRYADGNGLYLVVDQSGAKRWLLRTVIQGRRCDLGLGSARLVSLAEAREEARRLRAIARSGGNPKLDRERCRRVVPSFEECAHRVHEDLRPTWKNAKHADQWINTLHQYAFPKIGSRKIDTIGTPDVLDVLSPIWTAKHETARRLKQRLVMVFDWAKAAGFYGGDNPATAVSPALPRVQARPKHFRAMEIDRIQSFFGQLRSLQESGLSALGLQFLIVTAGRTGEVIGARKEELDLESNVWVVPAERMKAGREHRVPLSLLAKDIVGAAISRFPKEPYLFPGARPARPLTNMAFSMLLRRMGEDVTVHGFRSTFRDWASERTDVPHDICEMALAHTIKNKAEAAYRRGDLLEKRRELMEKWARFLISGS